MKTLYVHVGTPKTGTTAIQKFFQDEQNRELLEAKGFYYPIFPYEYPRKPKRRNGCFLTAIILGEDGKRDAKAEQEVLEDGLSKIKERFLSYNQIILSDEGIWSAVAKRRKKLWAQLKQAGERDGYRVKIIAYLRRQDEFLKSLWNQKIKHTDLSMTWQEFSDRTVTNLDYYKTLKAAADVLGVENIIVRRYERSKLKGGMSQIDFLDALGIPWSDEFAIETHFPNEKLSLNGCEIKRVINAMPELSQPEKDFAQKALQAMAEASSQDYPCDLWDAKEGKKFMRRFAMGNRRVVRVFLKDRQPLFGMSYRDKEVWEKDNPHMVKDIGRFAAESNARLLKRQQKLQAKIEKLQTEVEKLQK